MHVFLPIIKEEVNILFEYELLLIYEFENFSNFHVIFWFIVSNEYVQFIQIGGVKKRTGILAINRYTFVVSVALCRISPGQNSWEATVTAVRLKLTLPPASNVVSRLCSSWKMYFRTELWRTANRMENPPNPRIISRADSYRSKTGFTLLKENGVTF